MEDEGMALQTQLADWLELSEKRAFQLFWTMDIPWAHHSLAVTIFFSVQYQFFVTSFLARSSL